MCKTKSSWKTVLVAVWNVGPKDWVAKQWILKMFFSFLGRKHLSVAPLHFLVEAGEGQASTGNVLGLTDRVPLGGRQLAGGARTLPVPWTPWRLVSWGYPSSFKMSAISLHGKLAQSRRATFTTVQMRVTSGIYQRDHGTRHTHSVRSCDR